MRGEFKTMTRHFPVIFFAMVALGAMSIPLAAQAMDWYGGLGYGQAAAETNGGDLLGEGFAGSIDSTHTGWKALAGMELWDKYVAAEFGFEDLGQVKANGTVSGAYSAATSKAKAYTASVVGFIPFNDQLGAIIRAGLAGERVDFSTSGAIGAGAHTSEHVSDLKFFGGLGLQFDYSKNVAVRMEAERFTMGSLGSPNINLYTVGFIYRFGR